MRLKQDQQDAVKVTVSKYPFVKGEPNQSKSFTIYECEVMEVHDFLIEALENASEDEGGESGEDE